MQPIESPVEFPFEPESIGDRIQHARRLLGVFLGWDITQAHLAAFMNTSDTTVIGLEGDSVPVAPHENELCDALGIQRDFLLSGSLPMVGRLSAEARKRWTLTLNGGPTSSVIAAIER